MQDVYNDSTIVSVTNEDKFEKPDNFSIQLDCEDDETNIRNEFDDEFF
jgi:hypothetical protein